MTEPARPRDGAAPEARPARERVAMLVNNPCTNDSRVIREAEALAAAGHQVTVLARQAPALATEETVNGVTYLRTAGVVEPWLPTRRRQAAWRAALRERRRLDPGRPALTPLALLAYACTWRRAGAAPAKSAVLPASAAPAVPAASAADTATAAPAATAPPADAAAGAASPRAGRPGGPLGLLRKALRRPWSYAQRAVTPVIVFEDLDLAMAAPLDALRPTVVHAHDLLTLPTAARAARRLGARLVYDSHELELHRNAPYSALGQWWRARMERRHIGSADLVITVSDSIADHLAAQYRIPRPLVVLNAPSFDRQAGSSAPTLRARLELEPATPLAVYVGRVTFGRGLEFCVRALLHDPALHIAAVGPREDATQQRLRRLAAELGVESRFHLVDPVPPETVVPFIRDADVSLLPIQNVCLSYYYCMPNKLLESVMGGLPVAVADLVELRRFVERNRCGVVMDETDPASIARAIRRICDDRAAYRLDEAQIDAVKRRYSWETQARGLLAHYPGGTPA